MSIEAILLGAAILILLSVFASKISDRFAVPALVLFMFIGMLAGPQGPGGISIHSPMLAKNIGILALIFILFSGGINTIWVQVRPVLIAGINLSTLGVLITAVVIGVGSMIVLRFSFWEGMLLGAIISSTDAAAVFSVLKSKKIGLKEPLRPLLEFESGSNDPMAVFLTMGVISMIAGKISHPVDLIPWFFWDMGIGALVGYLIAKLGVFLINKVRLEFADLYSVMTIALVLLAYALASLLHGNGFLAVYVVGLVMNLGEFPNKKSIIRFHEGIAWLMQIAMFLVLGLLVVPSQMIPVIIPGILIVLILMFIARPLAVFTCLLPFAITAQKKMMISWVGLRGAVPIILATFPLLAGIPQSQMIFNLVFFVVVASVLLQGTSLVFISRILKVDSPFDAKRSYPIEFEKPHGFDADMSEFIAPYQSAAVGTQINRLSVPDKCLIVLILRNDQFIIPSGSTVIEGGDLLLVLANKHDQTEFQRILNTPKDLTKK